MMSPASAGSIWKTLLSQGAIPMGSNAWEKLRVFQGGEYFSNFLVYLFNVLVISMNNLFTCELFLLFDYEVSYPKNTKVLLTVEFQCVSYQQTQKF